MLCQRLKHREKTLPVSLISLNKFRFCIDIRVVQSINGDKHDIALLHLYLYSSVNVIFIWSTAFDGIYNF